MVYEIDFLRAGDSNGDAVVLYQLTRVPLRGHIRAPPAPPNPVRRFHRSLDHGRPPPPHLQTPSRPPPNRLVVLGFLHADRRTTDTIRQPRRELHVGLGHALRLAAWNAAPRCD